MAISGHTSPQPVINDPSGLSSYSGTVTGVVAGELVVVVLTLDGNTTTHTPSGYTVTLGSDTLSYVSSSGATSLAVGITAIFAGVATASGDLALDLVLTSAARALTAHAFRISGFDTTTPIANSDGLNNYGSTVTSLTTPNGVTTAASGNVIIGGMSIHSGGVTGLSVATADGSSVGNNGSSIFNDNSWGVAWKETTPAASVTFAWTWTSAQRCGGAWVEINAASGSVAISGALAATDTGADTAAITGAVAVTGIFAATDAGADTFAATGTVSAAGLTGSMSAVETGADTLAATGAVAVSGALAAVETGADTFAGAGSVVAAGIAGAMAAVEMGADTFVAAGAVLVSGTLAGQETGADTLAASGSVVITLTMAVTESGADSASFTGLVAVLGSMAAFETGADVFVGASDASSRRHATDAEAANGGTFPGGNGGTFQRANGGTIIRG